MRALASLILMTTTLVAGQRPPFAGTRPIGFPDTPNRTTTQSLENRFGEGTTERLPIEANGDRELLDRLSKLPIDKQPFWFINWQAYDEHRKNPQTYPQKPNVFVDPVTSNVGTPSKGPANADSSNSGTFDPAISNTEPNRPNNASVQSSVPISVPNASAAASSGFSSQNGGDSNLNNRFGSPDSSEVNTNSESTKPEISNYNLETGTDINDLQQTKYTPPQVKKRQPQDQKITDFYPQQFNNRRTSGFGN